MDYVESVVLGLVQGLTEFLPVSSSGHLVIGKALFGIETSDLSFEIVVHAATVLSTIVAFRKDLYALVTSFFRYIGKLFGREGLKTEMDQDTSYVMKIFVSMIPVFIVGVFFKDFVEKIFGSGLLIVGIMLLLTAFLLFLSERVKGGRKDIGYKEAFVIGVAQAFAVMPGLSRSGSTIATGLLLGVDKSKVAKFSFLMVMIPILGESFLELVSGGFAASESGIDPLVLLLGGAAAFLSGLFACKMMIKIVSKAKLWIFSIYCLAAGALTIILSVMN